MYERSEMPRCAKRRTFIRNNKKKEEKEEDVRGRGRRRRRRREEGEQEMVDIRNFCLKIFNTSIVEINFQMCYMFGSFSRNISY